METKYFECVCLTPEHTISFSCWDDDGDGDGGKELSVQVWLLSSRTFWGRLLHAIRYIYGYKSRYGPFEETLVGDEQLEALTSFLNRVRTEKLLKENTINNGMMKG